MNENEKRVLLPNPAAVLCAQKNLFQIAEPESDVHALYLSHVQNEIILQSAESPEAFEAMRSYVMLLHEKHGFEIIVNADTAFGRGYIRLWSADGDKNPNTHRLTLDVDYKRFTCEDGETCIRWRFVWHPGFVFE